VSRSVAKVADSIPCITAGQRAVIEGSSASLAA
jgi:hypothetical protein